MFKPTIEGVGAPTEFIGPRGPFYIAMSGTIPEFWNGTYYADGTYEFCFFYNELYDDKQNKVVEIDVYAASDGRRFWGLRPIIARADLDIVETNIRSVLGRRKTWKLNEELAPQYYREVTFSWGLQPAT